MKQTPVRASPDFIDDIGLEVNVQRAGHMFARGSLREKCAEASISCRRRTFLKATVGLNNMHQYTEEMQEGGIRFTLRPCSTVYNSPAIIARSLASCSECDL